MCVAAAADAFAFILEFTKNLPFEIKFFIFKFCEFELSDFYRVEANFK